MRWCLSRYWRSVLSVIVHVRGWDTARPMTLATLKVDDTRNVSVGRHVLQPALRS